ncbi:hypothetical protein BKA80DRAFT_277727 [Phyllosticta citrichinensis]
MFAEALSNTVNAGLAKGVGNLEWNDHFVATFANLLERLGPEALHQLVHSAHHEDRAADRDWNLQRAHFGLIGM